MAFSGGVGLPAPQGAKPPVPLRVMAQPRSSSRAPKAPSLGFNLHGGSIRPNFGPPGGYAPKSPSGGAALAPPAPAAPGASSSSPASPLDSTYFNNLAANQFKVGNQINSLTATSQNDNTALQDALAKLAYQQPRDSLRLEQNANRTGGLYSTVYDQNQGNLLNSYQTRESEATRANAQRQAAIQAQLTALQQGIPIFEGQQYDAAVGRATKAAASNPATGQPPISTTAPPVPTSGTVGGQPPGVATPMPAAPGAAKGLPAPPGAWGSRRALQTLARSGGRYGTGRR